MDPTAAKYIGAGIACIGMGGAGIGVGIIFGNYLAAALRNPSAAQGQFGNLIFGVAIFSLLMALLLLFGLCPRESPSDHGRTDSPPRDPRETERVPAVPDAKLS